MAKSKLRLRAREIRKGGESILYIARKIGVSKSTVSEWCRDIDLTDAQIKSLLARRDQRISTGQLKGAAVRKHQREERVAHYLLKGRQHFEKLSDEQFFIAGLALYLAEGAKTRQRFHFVNSDPRLIRFMLDWIWRFFKVPKIGVAPSLHINEVHRPREEVVLSFWSDYLGIPRSQFRSTVFVQAKQKKVYENHNRYFGTMRFQVLKGAELSYIIAGLMEGMLQHIPKPA